MAQSVKPKTTNQQTLQQPLFYRVKGKEEYQYNCLRLFPVLVDCQLPQPYGKNIVMIIYIENLSAYLLTIPI